MSNQQSTISQGATLLCVMASISQQKNDDQQARIQIRSIDGTSQDIDRLQFSISLNMCKIYKQQSNLIMANLLINEALKMAHELQQQDKITECLDTRGEIKRLQGDYDDALLDHNKSVGIKLKLCKF